MTEKVVPFPKLSEADQQWLDLKKQQELIRQQTKHIESKG